MALYKSICYYDLWCSLGLNNIVLWPTKFYKTHIAHTKVQGTRRLATSTRSDGHLWEIFEHDVVVLVEVKQRDWCEWCRDTARWWHVCLNADSSCDALDRSVVRRTQFLQYCTYRKLIRKWNVYHTMPVSRLL